jgi:hypothetical protein
LNKTRIPALVLGVFTGIAGQAATPPSVEDFASRPQVEDVSISPDGRYLALITTRNGRATAAVIDRQAGPDSAMHGVLSEPDKFRMTWCDWATNTRLLCGFRSIVRERLVYSITRLVGVDADGKNMRVLIQNSADAQGQFQDRVINWNPGPADTVLIDADEGLSSNQQDPGMRILGHVGTHALPAVFELNVMTGKLVVRQHAREPIRRWITDKRGEARIGWGFLGTTISYYARLAGDSDWRRLARFEAFTRENHFDPVAISADDPNKAYAFGLSEGRTALWLIDLTDKEDPRLVFAHPFVDASDAVVARDGRLIGVRYETGYPTMYFADDRFRVLMDGVAKLHPGEFSTIHGSTLDETVFVLRSISDIDAPHFLILDTLTGNVAKVGSTYPDRDLATLAQMRPISYPAHDGTKIPGYLSFPLGGPGTHLPLIVMPHSGSPPATGGGTSSCASSW